MSLLISSAHAATNGAAGQQANPLSSVIFIAALMIIFYFMLWRPQSKRAKEHRELLASLAKGDEVVTNGGVAGKIADIHDDFVSLTVSTDVNLTVQKQAIAMTLPKGTLKSL